MMADIETVTLSIAHAASSYGRPVLLIDGGALAYGPADVTPAGMTGAELVNQWAGRFAGQGRIDHAAELLTLLRDLWAGAMIGGKGAGFVNVSPDVTARVLAALREN
jgi:hypothetical protein